MGLRQGWPVTRGAGDEDFKGDLDSFSEYRQIRHRLGQSESNHSMRTSNRILSLQSPTFDEY